MAQSYYRDLFISREQEFKNIANKYDKAVFNEYFPSLMAILARLLLESPKDYLGTIFARLNLGQHYRGQFFTPSHICEFMAEITFNENLEKAIQEKGYCRVAEPTCGSGAMVLGLVKCLQNRGYEKLGGKLYIEATDIDELCVCMTYTQLSLLGLSFPLGIPPIYKWQTSRGILIKIPNLFFCFIFLVWMVWNIWEYPFNTTFIY